MAEVFPVGHNAMGGPCILDKSGDCASWIGNGLKSKWGEEMRAVCVYNQFQHFALKQREIEQEQEKFLFLFCY